MWGERNGNEIVGKIELDIFKNWGKHVRSDWCGSRTEGRALETSPRFLDS